MEAPDKIYLYREKPKDYFDEDWHESPASDVENVEYIRKDLLLELKEKVVAEMCRLEDYADEHWDVEPCKGAQRFSNSLYDFISKLDV